MCIRDSVNVEQKPQKRNPFAPFTTSTLQQEAARKLGFSTKRTMETVSYTHLDVYKRQDLGYPIKFDAAKLYSKGKNAAFDERLLQGQVLQCFVDGDKVFDLNIGHI